MVVREPLAVGRGEPLLVRGATPIDMTEVAAEAAAGDNTPPSCVSPAARDSDGGLTSPGSEVSSGSPKTVPDSPTDQQGSPQKQPVPRGYIPPALQNCLRCDACSCIYLDELDYYKHVRNYHSSTSQRRYRKSGQCRTCVFTKIEPDPAPTLKAAQPNHRRSNSPVKINVLQNNVKSRWSRMFGSRLRSQMTPLSTNLRAIDPSRVPLKSKVKMQAGLQPFVVRELDAKMQEMKQQRAAGSEKVDSPGELCGGDEGDTYNGDCGAAVQVKEEPRDQDECVDLLQQVEVRIKTEPEETEA
ncbi:hypothetical protein FJT64_007795 [Amphibalanus amphitrite]|uniref:C2H2-type domain-containing protein n=1 Tax=Amphibalanus amphitrite TaxID=1232801 RepID=A0A6A4VNR2_AMPAM|nr:hypothetical protein FJT64_007795 [Amphibalanus amphitrite]